MSDQAMVNTAHSISLVFITILLVIILKKLDR
jgi:hypothetical protein